MIYLTVSAKFAEHGTLLFFLRLGGAIGASTLEGLCGDDEAPTVFCFVQDGFEFDVFVLAMTSGSCNGRHAFSILDSFCLVPVENINVLNWENLFELVDAESKEFEDSAVTEAAFTRERSGKGPAKKEKALILMVRFKSNGLIISKNRYIRCK